MSQYFLFNSDKTKTTDFPITDLLHIVFYYYLFTMFCPNLLSSDDCCVGVVPNGEVCRVLSGVKIKTGMKPHSIKCLETTVVMIWCHINKPEVNRIEKNPLKGRVQKGVQCKNWSQIEYADASIANIGIADS